MTDPGFGGPLPHHDRQASGVPSLVASDASNAEASMNDSIGNASDHSSSSEKEVSLMPSPPPPRPPLSSLPTIEISPGVHVRIRGAVDYYMPAECICGESTILRQHAPTLSARITPPTKGGVKASEAVALSS
jgi:hypothetical protein